MSPDAKLGGYIRMYRAVQSNPVWATCSPAVFKVFLYCIMQASWTPSVWYDGSKEIGILPGTFVTTVRQTSADCVLSPKQIRDAFADLINLQIISVETGSRYHVVTVINYRTYQIPNEGTKAEISTNPQKGNSRAIVGQHQGKRAEFSTAQEQYSENGFSETKPVKTVTNERTDEKGTGYLQESGHRVRSFVEQKQFLKNTLASYFDGQKGEPDDALVLKVLKAGNGATVEQIQAALKYYYQNGQAPRDPKGPKTWGWFPVVISKHFAKAKRAVA